MRRPRSGKLVLDLIPLHDAVFGYDLLEQHAKLRNVPLAIAQCVEQPALGILGADLETGIEGPARSDHAKSFVEHQHRLADGVDDAMSKRACIRDVGELLSEIGRLHRNAP